MTMKRSLEDACVPFPPTKCFKQCGSFNYSDGGELKVDEDHCYEVVDDFDVVEHSSPRKPETCPQESMSVSKDAPTNNSSSQEHSSPEMANQAMQESSVSSPAPARYVLHPKVVPLGPDYQAEVPEWNGGAMPDDNTDEEDEEVWYGERVWPLCEEDVECCSHENVGKGRGDEECSCSDRGSVECVRKHVEEAKIRLMDELGPAYDLSGFDEMGESVSRHWTEEEEAAFREVVRQNPASSGKNFWYDLAVVFPTRSPMELVSYYFNVFVLRRRAIQNRVVPEDVDSDDDERYLPGTVSEWVAPEADAWSGSDEEEDEYDDYERPAVQDEDEYESGGEGEVGYEGRAYDYEEQEQEHEQEHEERRDQTSEPSSRAQIRGSDEDVMSHGMNHGFDDHKGELLAESFMRSSVTEMENMRRALPDSWMAPLEWNNHSSSSSARHHHPVVAGGASSGSGCAASSSTLELASTNGALQEFFGDDNESSLLLHQFLIDDKKQQDSAAGFSQFF